jgi:hypothetical protein
VTVPGEASPKPGRPAENATEKELRIVDLERELKEVREVAAAEKKRPEDKLVEEKRKAVEATEQFNTMSTGRSNLRADNLVEEGLLVVR